jgi:acyl-CoA synthetase (AMP-forming)/AMP-acid ligase II
LFNNAADCVERFGLRSQERIMIPVPIYHMYGLGAAFLPGVIAGASINLMARTNIIRYLDREKQFRPDVSFLTPSLCEMFLQARKSAYRHRLVVTAGDRIATTTFERFEGKFGKLVNLYGSTELGAIATSTLTDSLETRADGVLAPMPAVDIRFKKLEILCRHEHGFLDYVDTQGKKVAEPEGGWFQTKDLGKPVGDRCFKVMGRAGNSINRSGILVAFAEVESIMEQGIGGVAWVVVVAGDEENRRSKRMIACCELNPHAEVDARKIRARCFALMPRHMVPDEVVVMAEIPRLANGKFDRKKLAGLFGR